MGRQPEGWKLRRRAGRPYSVRFVAHGERYELGLGTSDPSEARSRAARIYADAIRGVLPLPERGGGRSGAGAGRATAEAFEQWLSSTAGSLARATREVYRDYARTISTALPTLGDLTTPAIAAYRDVRLSEVLAATVRKELAALRGLLTYALREGWIPEEIEVPRVGRAAGTRSPVRRRVAADELSPEEIAAFLDALPEWSTSRKVARFPVRARFIVAYETSLRPATLDQLSVPEHWRRGQTWITVPPELDKKRQGRRVPLTPAALAALESAVSGAGLIFGAHDYRDHVQAAARVALAPEKARRFTGQHLRSARISHLLEATGNITGVMRLAGHTQLGTTSRYNRASDRAAEDVIAAVSGLARGRRSGAA